MRLIDADALLPMMKYATIDNEIGVFPIKIGFNVIAKVINEAPTVDAEPVRHSKWVIKSNFDEKVNRNYQHILCSECRTCVAYDWEGKLRTALNYKYCPTCGAKIDEECDDETD